MYIKDITAAQDSLNCTPPLPLLSLWPHLANINLKCPGQAPFMLIKLHQLVALPGHQLKQSDLDCVRPSNAGLGYSGGLRPEAGQVAAS